MGERSEEERVLLLMRSLWRVDHGLQSLSKRMEQRIGLTGPQRLVLRTIERRPGLSAGELASELSLHPSTLTGILRRLEERGHLERRIDRSDRRRALLRITEHGKKAISQSAGTVEAVVAELVRSTPEEALETATRVLDALSLALADEVE